MLSVLKLLCHYRKQNLFNNWIKLNGEVCALQIGCWSGDEDLISLCEKDERAQNRFYVSLF